MSEIRTLAEVMEWLPRDIRDAITATTPCPLGGGHYWWHNQAEIRQFGQVEPIRVIEHWTCTCGAHVNTDPGTFE